MRNTRVGLFAVALAALTACGSGGGGGGGGGGDFGDGGLVVTPRALTYTYVMGGPAPLPQTISASWTTPEATVFGAFLPEGTPQPSWLPSGQPSNALFGSKTATIQLTLTASGVTVGVHTVKILVGIGKVVSGTLTPIAYREVTVTYVVKSFGATPTTVASSAVLGSSIPPATRTVTVSAPTTTAWSASADRPWIHVSPTTGSTPQTVTISFDPAGLATGTHAGTVTFSAGAETSPVAVTLTVAAPALSATPATVQLAGLGGHDLSPKTVQVSLDTGTNAWPWTATTTADWIDLVQLASTVAAGPTAFTVAPTAAAAAWPAGSYQATVLLTADVNGLVVQRTVTVGYAPDDLKLRVSDDGVALASTPGLSRLERTIQVSTNRGIPAAWTATSDQPWLDPTPAGTTGDPLVLAVDPVALASLATDAVHEATVTISSSEPGLAVATEIVRVGLWVGSFTPEILTTVAGERTEAATDPVRPYAYVHDGGSALTVLNVHTGAVVDTVAGVGTALGSMAVASDGTTLFVVDAPSRTVVPVDLATFTPGAPWALPPGAPATTRIAYARTNGVPVLLTTEGSMHAPATGASLGAWGSTSFYGSTLAASRDGSRLCRLVLGLSPSSQECRALDATSAPGAPLAVLVGPAMSGSGGSNGEDVALSPDGTRSYVASGGVYEFIVVDATRTVGGSLPTLGFLPAAPFPVAVEVGFDGRVYGGAITSLGSPSVWVYEPDGTLVRTYEIWNVRDQGLAISGDGLRLVVRTAGSAKLVTVPP